MKLKEITFHLENCDHITIDGKYVGDFLVDKIKTRIGRVACNAINKMDVAYAFAIEIHKDADKPYYEFGFNSFINTVFDRLFLCNDITQIDFTLVEDYVNTDGIQTSEDYHYQYYVNWCGESDFENEAQTNYISSLGHLYIVIEENGKIDNYFNRKEIDNKEAMDGKIFMYHVGDENY